MNPSHSNIGMSHIDAPPPCEHGEFGYCADCEWDAHEERGPMDLEDELAELLSEGR